MRRAGTGSAGASSGWNRTRRPSWCMSWPGAVIKSPSRRSTGCLGAARSSGACHQEPMSPGATGAPTGTPSDIETWQAVKAAARTSVTYAAFLIHEGHEGHEDCYHTAYSNLGVLRVLRG